MTNPPERVEPAQPLVSAIMPAYNASRTIRDSIDSVLAQTHRPIELIVINDGSSDDTDAVVRSYGERVVYREQPNGGASAARNHGLSLARGQFIAFLDADDLWRPQKTARQLETLRERPDIGLLTCRFTMIDDDDRVVARSGINVGYTGPRHDGAVVEFTALHEMLFENRVGPPSGVLMRRACYDEMGGFDESLLNAAEDWEFYLRVLKRFKIALLNENLYRYRESADSSSSARHAARLLKAEIAMLDKVFADPAFEFGWKLRHQAYARRYERAAFAYGRVDQRSELLRALLKAVACYPPSAFGKRELHHALQALLGRERLNQLKRALQGVRRTSLAG